MKNIEIGLQMVKKSLIIPHLLFLEFEPTNVTKIAYLSHLRYIVELEIVTGAGY